MADDFNRRTFTLALGAAALTPAAALAQAQQTYSQDEVLGAAQRFFGEGAEGLADVVGHIFSELGRPTGYIEGNEGSGAAGVGLRYGNGYLRLRNRPNNRTRVYWQGPSVGFDTGGNGSRTFTLVYNMSDPNQIYRRYPGVDGSAYLVGGVSANYQRRDGITLAPIRMGVGLRLGASIGYLNYSRRRRLNPF